MTSRRRCGGALLSSQQSASQALPSLRSAFEAPSRGVC